MGQASVIHARLVGIPLNAIAIAQIPMSLLCSFAPSLRGKSGTLLLRLTWKPGGANRPVTIHRNRKTVPVLP